MTEYIKEENEIPEKYLIRLPNKGALLKGDLAIMIDELKAKIDSLKNGVLIYDRLKTDIPQIPKNSPFDSSNLTNIGTIIATRGDMYTPYKVDKWSSDFWSTPSIKIP